MTHVYGAHLSPYPGIGMLENYIMMMYVGFLGDLWDTLLKLAGCRQSFTNSFSDSESASLIRSASCADSLASAASLASAGGMDAPGLRSKQE